MDTQQFKERANDVHNDRYDYSAVKYTNRNQKVSIKCVAHGQFDQVASTHLNGSGCIKCGCKSTASKLAFTKEQFVERARLIHGDRYDYSLVDYKNSKTKIIIVCLQHGQFLQLPHDHLDGHGCKGCANAVSYTLLNTKQFVDRARLIHGDRYDYSLVDYKKSNQKVIIICLQHGQFLQTPNAHLNGNKCPTCKHKIRV